MSHESDEMTRRFSEAFDAFIPRVSHLTAGQDAVGYSELRACCYPLGLGLARKHPPFVQTNNPTTESFVGLCEIMCKNGAHAYESHIKGVPEKL